MPSIGMLLCKDHSSDPPTAAASATPTSSKVPYILKEPPAASSSLALCDDNPQPSKSQRPVSLGGSVRVLSGATLQDDMVSVPRKKGKPRRLGSFVANAARQSGAPTRGAPPKVELVPKPKKHAKPKRLGALVANAARLSGVPLKAEQVSMTIKQSKRAYADVASTSSGKTGTACSLQKSAPFKQLTNSPMVESATFT